MAFGPRRFSLNPGVGARKASGFTPRGILPLEDGDWAVPVIFGVDHNNLGLLGGNLGFTDLIAIWDEEGLQAVLADVPDAGDLLASLDTEDVVTLGLMRAVVSRFRGADALELNIELIPGYQGNDAEMAMLRSEIVSA